MFKKIAIYYVAIGMMISSSYGKSGLSDVDELMKLPHPVKVIMQNKEKFNVTKAQSERLDKDMLAVYPKKITTRMQKASKIEKELKKEILINNKTNKELKNKIDKLAKIKREVTDIHIDALNTLTDIMGKENMQKAVKMMEKQKVKAKNNKFKIDELAILPHPGKFIKQGKIKISKEQKQRMVKEVKKTSVPLFQEKMREAFKLEKKLQRAVKKGKSKEELKGLLDQIMTLKREAMDHRIDALNKLQGIIGEDNWKKVHKLTYK